MRSATSCSKTLIRSDWRRFWPAAFLYAFISFFMLPLILWINQPVAGDFSSSAGRDAASVVLDVIPGFVILNFFFGLILAMAVYGYLMAGKSVGLMHALPVSRNRQFLSHFAAGVSMLTAGNLLTLLLSLGMEAVMGAVELRSLLLWLVITELTGFFFLAFATLCTVITGWLLAVPVIYVGFNFVVFLYQTILEVLAKLLYPSYVGPDFAGSVVEWLTPVVKLVNVTGDRFGRSLRRPGTGVTVEWLSPKAMPTVLIYAAVGLAMLGLALVLYRRRHSESAGDAVAFKPLRPVARYMISIAGGLALGTLVHQMITWGGRNAVSLILWQLLMGGLVYCAVEMLLRKSYKIFDRRTAVGLLALWLVLAGVTGSMKLDLTGYEKRVPAADRVEEVSISVNGYETDLAGPDSVQAVLALHRALARQGTPALPQGSVRLEYHLKNGALMNRRYEVDLENPAVHEAMTEVLNQPLMRRALLLQDYGRYGETFTGGYAENLTDGRSLVLSPEDCQKLYQALRADMERPVTPELLWDTSSILNVGLTTNKGSYRLWQVRLDCADTIGALIEIGVIDSQADLISDNGWK